MIDETSVRSIEELHRLKTEGIITEAEFEKAKERVLFGGTRAAPGTGGPVPTPAANDHIGWIMLPLRRYADFSGRSSRREFWMFQLLPFVIILGLLFFIDRLPDYGDASLFDEASVGLLTIAMAGLFVPMVAVEVRRMHDREKSGLLALLNLIPYVGALVIYILALFPGTTGDNRFGPEQKG